MEATADIGLIGLAVMGQNLVLNMNDHGFVVSVYNRTVSKVDDFLANEAKGTQILGAHSIQEFVSHLKRPRRVMLLVKAGQAVDDFIEQLLPYLEPGDIIIDGGNSLYQDSMRRTAYLESKGFQFIGTGVSGGEEGARRGPSIMPGGSKSAWPHVKDIFQSISAKVDDGAPCCDWVGEDGAGHYVKMVHNGIEYGDMQLICEAYQLDTAGQKGTGKWTVISSADLGIPITLIAEAVYSRCVSAMKEERVAASKKLRGPKPIIKTDRAKFIEDIRQALYASKIVSYAQGYMLLRAAAKEYNWKLNYGGIALMWRGGCIIRSQFLGKIKEAYDKRPRLANLMLDPHFKREIRTSQKGWRNVIATAVKKGIPVPAFATALNFYDSYRSERLPANLLQAQRDYFGAHTYERVDKPRGEFFHTNWTGTGGRVSSSTYTV